MNLKRKSDTYVKIYTDYRKDQLEQIVELKTQVAELRTMVEFLCKKVFE